MISLGSALLCLALLLLIVLWRLSVGPISLGFMSAPIEALINSNLAGMRLELADAIIERSDSGRPRIRLRDVRLTDPQGELLAEAPRASLGLDGSALWTGRVLVRKLELIGPHILVRRSLDGNIALGVGQAAAPDDEFVLPRSVGRGSSQRTGTMQVSAAERKSDARQLEPGLFSFIHKELLSDPDAGETAASSLEAIVITDARVSLFDAINDATWEMPEVNLNFQRDTAGLKLIANADVASGPVPWKLNVVASYADAQDKVVAQASIQDLVPADLSGQIFSLSQLAEVKVPLSGEARFEMTGGGRILRADAVLSAAAGYVGFPGFISQPILVDEGVLRLSFEPESGDIVIGDSAFFIGGSQAKLNGVVHPVQAADGRVSALQLELKAHGISLDTTGTIADALAIDNIDFVGTALLDQGSLRVDDLVLRAGNAGVRLRGTFTETPEAVAVRFGARLNQVPLEMLKKLWPPMAAPAARNWINAHVSSGVITDGEMIVDLPGAVIANALAGQAIPDENITFNFSLAGVDTRYYAELPPIRNATGGGVLRGDSFDLQLDNGVVTLPSGATVELARGTMKVTHLMVEGTRAAFELHVRGPAQGFIELVDQPPLQYISKAGLRLADLGGTVEGLFKFELPLSADMTADQVALDAQAKIRDVSLPNALHDISINGGELDVTVTMQGAEGRGNVLLNGVRSALDWRMSFINNTPDERHITARATLSDGDRQRLGIDINDLVAGPIDLTVNVDLSKTEVAGAEVEADLSKATLMVQGIHWERPPSGKTRATMKVAVADHGALNVTDFALTGTDLDVRGDFTVNARGDVQRSHLPVVRLGQGNDLSLVLHRLDDNRIEVAVDGASFDARPMISALFEERDTDHLKPLITQMKGKIASVIGFRNERLVDVEFSGSASEKGIAAIKLTGRFNDGSPFAMTMEPKPQGRRLMTASSENAGAVLRAMDLYSRVRGGRLQFTGLLGPAGTALLDNGQLRLQSFEVMDEPALQFDEKGNPVRLNPRQAGRTGTMVFSNFSMPFSANAAGVYIGDTLLQGPALGATAKGVIRKQDKAIDIGGTIIPAYALNSLLSAVPVLGEMLMGGKGQGMFGITFAIRGTTDKPQVLFNPISALAPGFLRKIFEFQGSSGTRAVVPSAPARRAPPPSRRLPTSPQQHPPQPDR